MLGIIRFLWSVYRSSNLPGGLQPLALFCLITYASYLLIATVAGGFFLPETIWLLILLIAALHHWAAGPSTKEQPTVPMLEPVRNRAAVNRR
jgi:hypothetical protein